jgi:putative transposase
MVVMVYDPRKHHRRSIRLEDYDYSQSGAYFVTICTKSRKCLFGEVEGDTVRLSIYGEIVQEEWLRTAIVRPYVILDEFVVMPNHIHEILFITDAQPEGVVGTWRCHVHPEQPRKFGKPVAGSLSSILGSFKSAVTRRINQKRAIPGETVWQQRFYDRIIRDEAMLNTIRQYIQTNPARWAEDEDNPANIK